MSTGKQFLTYAAIGVASNAALYGLYLGLTAADFGHKTAMTVLFAAGMLWTFLLNRRWTFKQRGHMAVSAWRYAGVYGLAYLANVGALALLVDRARLPHETVMLALIVATACLLFAAQKLWVFQEA